jgi:hypothetical protein
MISAILMMLEGRRFCSLTFGEPAASYTHPHRYENHIPSKVAKSSFHESDYQVPFARRTSEPLCYNGLIMLLHVWRMGRSSSSFLEITRVPLYLHNHFY